jgi:hypothetical protein
MKIPEDAQIKKGIKFAIKNAKTLIDASNELKEKYENYASYLAETALEEIAKGIGYNRLLQKEELSISEKKYERKEYLDVLQGKGQAHKKKLEINN